MLWDVVRSLPLTLTLTLTLACTSNDTAETTTVAGESSAGETGCGDQPRARDCTEESVACQGFDEDMDGALVEADAVCMWPLLRDRPVGTLLTVDLSLGDSPTTVTLVIGADGQVMRQVSHYSNGTPCASLEPLQGCTLREPAFFDGCLTTVTPECLAYEGWYTGCATIDACP